MQPRFGAYEDVEQCIQNALDSIDDDEKPNLSALSREFVVPYDRLRQRYRGRQSRMDRPRPNQRLNADQELALR